MIHISEKRLAYRFLFQKPERRKPLGRPRRRWERVNIKIVLQKVGHSARTGMIWLRIWPGDGLL
jgi:hypothetical protein